MLCEALAIKVDAKLTLHLIRAQPGAVKSTKTRHQPPWFARQPRDVQHTLGRTAVQSLNHRAARCIGRRISGC